MRRRSQVGPSALRYYVRPLFMVAPMLAVTTLTGQRDLIFPEGAALTFGIAVIGDPEWSASSLRIVVLPTLCAVLGHMLAAGALPRSLAEIVGVSGAFLVLQGFGSRIAPALSAAVLPVVFDVRSWLYPAIVLATCLTIVAVISCSPARDNQPFRAERHPVRWRWQTVLAGWLVITAWILIAGPVLQLPASALAPPLFVSAFEWLTREPRTLAAAERRCALLTGAALAGSVAAAVAPTALLAGAAGVTATLVLTRVLKTAHPPALAISLIPLIARSGSPWHFTWAIALGATALYVSFAAAASVERYTTLWSAKRAAAPGLAPHLERG